MLNGYFVCVNEYANYYMKLGKIYKFTNGAFIREDGGEGGDYINLQEFNTRNHTKIKEIKNNVKR